MAGTKIHLGIVEDNPFSTKALQEKLSFFDELQVRFSVSNGAEAVEKLKTDKHIDLLLMDIEMPVMNGVDATQKIKQLAPHVKVIMLTVFDNDDLIFKAIMAGADGYLLKDVDAKSLYQGILDTLEGGAAMTPSIALKTIKLLQNPIQVAEEAEMEQVKLSERELEVLQQISNGLSYTQIAENLFVSPSTIRKHTENIYKKLQVNSKLEAIDKARLNRLI
ncbi:MAG: response regulator transcription factor [Bacteroidetes bacterium]|nr:MAG: response regulator transcription factor [Bacteroidota bacterium]